MWVTVLMAVLLVPGCSRGPVRPAPRDWSDTWVAAQELIPPQSPAGVPDAATCEHVLVSLREIRSELTPAPDKVLEDAVHDWLAQAEHMFFECFDAGSDPRTAYERLDRLRQQVDAALEVAGASSAGTSPRRRGVRNPGFASARGSIARGSP